MKKILPIIVGIIVGGVIVGIVEGLGHQLSPSFGPEFMNLSWAEKKVAVSTLPVSSFLWVIGAWISGSFASGLASRLTQSKRTIPVHLYSGGVLMLFGLMNFFAFPHPIWVMVSWFFCFLPFALLGGLIVDRLRPSRES